MHDSFSLRYHQATLDLLQAQPHIEAASVEALDDLQRKYQAVLPASVREWYSLQEAAAWLDTYSNDDHAIPVQWLGATERYWEAGYLREQDVVQQGILP